MEAQQGKPDAIDLTQFGLPADTAREHVGRARVPIFDPLPEPRPELTPEQLAVAQEMARQMVAQQQAAPAAKQVDDTKWTIDLGGA